MNFAQQIKLSSEKLLEVLKDCDQARFIAKRSVDCWSVAEVLEHLTLVDQGVLQLYRAAMLEPPRPVFWLKRVLPFHAILPIRLVNVSAPSQVMPSKASFAPMAETILNYQKARSEILEFLAEHASRMGSLTPKHPILGYLTGKAMQKVLLGHERRHLKQIQDILGRV